MILDVTQVPEGERQELKRRLDLEGWRLHPLDLDPVDSKDSLLDAFAAALEFPSWFGRNWDAFIDCAGDLPGSHACWITGYEAFRGRCPDLDRALRDVMSDVEERSREGPAPSRLQLVFVS